MPAAANLIRQSEAVYRWRCKEARSDLATFIETVGQNDEGAPIELDWIHRAWLYHVNYCWQRGLHAMIQAPMESGKSSALVAPLAAWLIGLDPQVRIKVVCNGDDLAQKRVAATKRIIESTAYRDVFPNVRPGPKWAEMEFTVQRQGMALDATMQARGVGSKGVGLRADYILFDDVCDQLNTIDEGQRTKVKLLVRQTWLTRLAKPHGRCLWIATAWHSDDASADLLSDARFCGLVQRVRMPDLEWYEQELFGGNASEYLAGMVPTPTA